MVQYYVHSGKLRKWGYDAYLAEDVERLATSLKAKRTMMASPVSTSSSTYYSDRKHGRTQFSLHLLRAMQDAMVLAELRYLLLIQTWPFVGMVEELPQKLRGIAGAMQLPVPAWTPVQRGAGATEKYPLAAWEQECEQWNLVSSEIEWQLRQVYSEIPFKIPLPIQQSRRNRLHMLYQERSKYVSFTHSHERS